MNRLVLGILTYQVLLFASSPSFNCRKASTIIEYTICGSETLSKLDSTMAQKYFELKRQFDGDKYRDLVSKQRSWLRERNKCSNIQCLEILYIKQIAFLSSKFEEKEEEEGLGRKMCKQGEDNCLTLGGTKSQCSNWCR